MKKSVFVKNVQIGGGAPVSVQTMTNTPTYDVKATVDSVNRLSEAGADIVRISVPDLRSVAALKKIILETEAPIVADVHFDPDIAVAAVEAGAHKLRLNPANMPERAIKNIACAVKERNIPVRIGVNAGSLKESVSPVRLAEITADAAKRLEDSGLTELVLAVKSSDVKATVEAYRALDKMSRHPLHIGLTEAGTERSGSVKSAIAIGALLLDGIGDTLRVSLSGDPLKEVMWGYRILRAAGVRNDFAEVIACPTCARTEIDVTAFAEKIESITANCRKQLKIAVMGCAVNGIGESRGAEIAVCGGKDKSLIFKGGKPYKTVENSRIFDELTELIKEKIGE